MTTDCHLRCNGRLLLDGGLLRTAARHAASIRSGWIVSLGTDDDPDRILRLLGRNQPEAWQPRTAVRVGAPLRTE